MLVVDNHDSFVHTLVGYLLELGAEVTLREADAAGAISPAAAQRAWTPVVSAHDAVLISPGPGAPADAGASTSIVQLAARLGRPLLGVCLGHQAIGEAFGGRVGRAPELMHGMVSRVTHDRSALFEGIRSPFVVGRYHSLAIDEAALPPPLRVTARAEQGTIMAIAHRSLPIVGVQFHPESVLTESGHRLLGNWLGSVLPAQAAGGTQ